MLIRNAQVAHNFFTFACHYCMVPENIQTPTMERIGNSRGVGGSDAHEIPEWMGIGQLNHFPRG